MTLPNIIYRIDIAIDRSIFCASSPAPVRILFPLLVPLSEANSCEACVRSLAAGGCAPVQFAGKLRALARPQVEVSVVIT